MEFPLTTALRETAEWLGLPETRKKFPKLLVAVSFGDVSTGAHLPTPRPKDVSVLHVRIDPLFKEIGSDEDKDRNIIELRIPFAWPEQQPPCLGRLSPLQQLIVAPKKQSPWGDALERLFSAALDRSDTLLWVNNQVIWQPGFVPKDGVRVDAAVRTFVQRQNGGMFKGRVRMDRSERKQLDELVALADNVFLETLDAYFQRQQTFVITPSDDDSVSFSYLRAQNYGMEELCDIPHLLRDAWVASGAPDGKAVLVSQDRAFLLDRVLELDGKVRNNLVSFYAWAPDADRSVDRIKLSIEDDNISGKPHFSILSGVAEHLVSQMGTISIGFSKMPPPCKSDSLLHEVVSSVAQNTVPKEWAKRVGGAKDVLRGVCSVETGGGGDCLFSSIAFLFNAVLGDPEQFSVEQVRDAVASEISVDTLREASTVLDDLSQRDIGKNTALHDAMRLARAAHGDEEAPRSVAFLNAAPLLQTTIATALRARLRADGSGNNLCWGSVPMISFLMKRPELRGATFVVFDVDKGPVGVFPADGDVAAMVFGLVRVGQHFRALAPVFLKDDAFPQLVDEMIRVHGPLF